MIVAQKIIDDIISKIETEIQGTTGDGIGIFDVNNRVVSLYVSSSGEREYFGIDDTKGNRFYIRLNGAVTESRVTGTAKRGSCGLEDRVRIPLRLVVQHVCQDPRTLVEAFKRALFRVRFLSRYEGFAMQYTRLIPVSFNPIPWDVYAAETKKDAKTLNSLMQIVSIDFILEYQYNYADNCPQFDIC